MVGNATSLTKNGLRDWLVQRVTAIVLAVYIFFIVGYIMVHSPLQFEDWHMLFVSKFMRIFSLLALLSLFYHSWIGLWTIFTDYIKCSALRLTLQVIVILVLLGYAIWGISIVWGI